MALTQVTPDVVHNVQSNITQVGTLSNLTVTGNVSAGNVIATNFTGTASLANNTSFLGGTPAASYALESTVTTANTNMKGYVDAANTIQSGQISTTTSAITTANTNMKGYVDAVTTAWTANAGVQAGIISNLTNYANANVASYLPTYSGNILAANITTANITTTGNVTIGSTAATPTKGGPANPVGSLTTRGGVWIGGNLFVYGSAGLGTANIWCDIETTGSAIFNPGGAFGTLGNVRIRHTAISTSTTSGALQVSGGVGVGGRLTATDLTVTNTISGSIDGTANNASFLGGIPAANYLTTAGLGGLQAFTSSGVFTIPTGVTKVKVTVVGGGGGGGGGTTGGSSTSGGGGGGGGGGAIKLLTGLTPGNSITVTFSGTNGAGGAAGTTSGVAGTAGYTVSISGTGITTITADGGAGGNAGGTITTAGESNGIGGAGGSVANGDINIPGSQITGNPNAQTTAAGRRGGAGGASLMGLGGRGGFGPSTLASTVGTYGGGGGGGGANAGSAGGSGIVIFEW
jgi:hypothetical protein